MKTANKKRLLSLILMTVLIAAMALLTSGCDGKRPEATEISTEDAKVLGEGSKAFDFTVLDGDGNESAYVIKTDAETIGEALFELGLIEGEEGAYGLYVKSVCGKRYDYEEDGKYWAFFIDGEYATTGADTTKIEEGKTYSFQAVEG